MEYFNNNVEDIVESWEQEIIQEEVSRRDAIDKIKPQLQTVYQHMSKYILQPEKRSKSWADDLNGAYFNAETELKKLKKDKAKSVLKALAKDKDEIVKNGADEALDEIDLANAKVKDRSLFYSGKVPEIFNIETMFDDKAKFIENIQAARAEYDKIDTRRSFENDKAIETLDDYKYITTKSNEKRKKGK